MEEVLASAAEAADAAAAEAVLSQLKAIALGDAAAELLDERSFDIFDAAVRLAPASAVCRAEVAVILEALARHASAREVFCMLMEAFGKGPSPHLQLLLLRTAAAVLPRIVRKRADFVCTCLSSLGARYLGEWPGDEWDEEAEEEAEAPEEETPLSSQLLSALLDCVAPLGADAAAAAAEDADEVSRRARALVLGFAWQLLELSMRDASATACGPLAARARAVIDDSRPTLEELFAHVDRAAAAAAAEAEAAVAVGAEEAAAEPEELTAAAMRWSMVGMALYLSGGAPPGTGAVGSAGGVGGESQGSGSGSGSCGGISGDDAAAAEPSAPLDPCTSLVVALLERPPVTARLSLLCRLGDALMRSGRHGARGVTLLGWGVRGVAEGSMVDEAEQAGAERAVRALTTVMAQSPEQAQRSGAYKALQALLGAWPAGGRFELLRALLVGCPFPNVIALLVHRLKEEHLREASCRRAAAAAAATVPSAAAASTSDAAAPAAAPAAASAAAEAARAAASGVFSAGTLLDLLEPLLAVPRAGEATDPLDSLDALMGALNLLRLLLTRASASGATDAHSALDASAVGSLRREALTALDAWVRRRMDTLHAEIGAAERVSPAPEGLVEMRMSFTHLHVATDVVARSLELAQAFAGP